MKTLIITIFFSFSVILTPAHSKTILNCTQSNIGNLKNQNLEVIFYKDLKKNNSVIDVEINNEKFTGKWKNVFDEMLNENVDVIQGEKEISGLIYFFSYGPKRKILGYEIIDQNNRENSQFGLLGCK